MMVSADGNYCCEPDMDSDTLTIVDPTPGSSGSPHGKGLFSQLREPGEAVADQKHPAGLPRRLGRIHGGRQIQLLLWVRGRESRRHDRATLEIVRTIELESKLTLNGYVTADPNGKHLYGNASP
jgi:hypothetical protein